MTDDPCDELPAFTERALHVIVMLERTTDPALRRMIKYGMNQMYGRAVRFITANNDPHDNWSASTDRRPFTVVLDRDDRPMKDWTLRPYQREFLNLIELRETSGIDEIGKRKLIP